jgi:syntaxin-binding protein 5
LFLAQFQPHRLLVTYHTDLSIRFRDLSAQLLVSSDTAPLQSDFPTYIPELTIDLLSVLAAPSIASHTSHNLVTEARISSVCFATQSLECAVVLHTGEIAVFRQGQGLPQSSDGGQELISTSHISVPTGGKFHPSFLLVTNRGPATACALSDIGMWSQSFANRKTDVFINNFLLGFFAAAFQDGSLFVVDMRGPNLILRSLPERGANKRRSLLHRHEVDPVRELTWTIACTDAGMLIHLHICSVVNLGRTYRSEISSALIGYPHVWLDGNPPIISSP